MSRSLKLLAVAGVTLGVPLMMSAQGPGETVLIRAAKPYTTLVAAIEAQGGHVTQQFKHVDGIAAEIPMSALPAIRSLVGTAAVSKDLVVSLPGSRNNDPRKAGPAVQDDANNVQVESTSVLDDAAIAELASVNPAVYLANNGVANVSGLHAAGYTGAGTIVALIDSGIRPGFPHISLDGSVIGCEDFVGDALGCTNAGNDGHGTFVAGMVSANVIFGFAPTSAFRLAVLAECPECFFNPTNPPTNTLLPMVGTAPSSSIYMLRVFGATGGSPTSRIIKAIDRIIDLRTLADQGSPLGRRIQVVNMSLGGPTIFPGGDLGDQAVDALLDHDIVPAIAAGNAGPSSLTIGSPSSSFSAITVGAANLARNERILRRVQFGPAVGALYRPFLGDQLAYFSSRGPDADGRNDPDVVASGFASFGQGFGTPPGGISIASGTSFATPTVAGVAAVLRQRFPTATARQIRNAIIASGNPSVLEGVYTPVDQGSGYIDAGAAENLLATGTVPDTLATGGKPNGSVKVNVEKNTDLDVRDGLVQETFTGLRPGERQDILYRVHENTSQVVVALGGVTPALPLNQQNQLFGDDILFAVHSAKTSSIGEGDYKVFEFTSGSTHSILDPETGIMRVTVSGDWTNAGAIAASVSIFSLTDPIPGFTQQGKVLDNQLLVFPVTVPAGVSLAEFRLGWREDWGQFPTNDLDLILVRPNGTVNVDGATLNNPEVATINKPAAGQWLALVNGFDVSTGQDKFELRIALDGKVVKK